MEFLQRGVAVCCDKLENVDGQLLIIWVSKKVFSTQRYSEEFGSHDSTKTVKPQVCHVQGDHPNQYSNQYIHSLKLTVRTWN